MTYKVHAFYRSGTSPREEHDSFHPVTICHQRFYHDRRSFRHCRAHLGKTCIPTFSCPLMPQIISIGLLTWLMFPASLC